MLDLSSWAAVYPHLLQSFRLTTQKAYTRMFADFMTFLVVSKLLPDQVDIYILLGFIEYSHSNQVNPGNISNYMAAIRALFDMYHLPIHIFTDEKK